MQSAINTLIAELNRKTCYSTKEMSDILSKISVETTFSSVKASLMFSQACQNFDMYSSQNNKTTWGRNEFKQWFINSELPKRQKHITTPNLGIGNPDMADPLGAWKPAEPLSQKDDLPPWKARRPETPNPNFQGESDAEDLISKCRRLEQENATLRGIIKNLEVLVHTMELHLNTIKELLGLK